MPNPKTLLAVTLNFLPLLAEIDGKVAKFLDYLQNFFLIIGALIIAYGGYLLHQGRIPEALLAIFGGFVIALAVPMMKLFMTWAA